MLSLISTSKLHLPSGHHSLMGKLLPTQTGTNLLFLRSLPRSCLATCRHSSPLSSRGWLWATRAPPRFPRQACCGCAGAQPEPAASASISSAAALIPSGKRLRPIQRAGQSRRRPLRKAGLAGRRADTRPKTRRREQERARDRRRPAAATVAYAEAGAAGRASYPFRLLAVGTPFLLLQR